MGSTLQQIRSRLGTRGIAATAALLVALVVAVATPEILGTRVAAAFGALDLVTTATAVSIRARNRDPHGRAGHLLDSFRALGRNPAAALRLVAWVALSTAGRLAAATAVAAALGLHHPLAAAIVIIPA